MHYVDSVVPNNSDINTHDHLYMMVKLPQDVNNAIHTAKPWNSQILHIGYQPQSFQAITTSDKSKIQSFFRQGVYSELAGQE